VRPGMMVTMDYSAARLNVGVDTGDVILTLTCG
jgi:Peptidase inhibitor I78 family